MRIVTWNVNSLKARLDRVEQWIRAWEPDVVCLQETKMADDAFPAMTFQAMGYDAVHHGQGRWNGVAILSRVGMDDVRVGFSDDEDEDEDARLVWATCGGVRVGSVYVPNGRTLDDDHYQYKLAFLDRLRRVLQDQEKPEADLILTGDFNIAPTDLDVYDPAEFVGTTHTSEAERKALAAMAEWGTSDLFRGMYDAGSLYSWWDYRGGSFHKRKGMRIDLMMTTKSLTERVAAILIDREERKPTGNPAGGTPSDHAPLVADFTQEPRGQ
jgi:exodeoxyribonuclease-3